MMKPIVAPGRSEKIQGFSLIELLIAITIGLLLLAGLTLIFVNSSQANRELQQTAQQIENGRYAIDVISQDLKHAGYYGHFYELPDVPATAPDPCNVASLPDLESGLSMPVQGFAAANLVSRPVLTATSCALLTTANLKPGSDVLVVRRAGTKALAATDVALSNRAYIQSTGLKAEIRFGNGAAIGTNKADGSAATLDLSSSHPPYTPAPIRLYNVHVYFVAPCSVGSGANGVCQAVDDSIPTLKRLELGAGVMQVVALVEGVEYLKVEYGVDDAPTPADKGTGLTGDGVVDGAYSAPPAGWANVIAAKVYVLARNTAISADHTDTKTYTLGLVGIPAANDRYKRHVFSSMVRLVNPAGRREIP